MMSRLIADCGSRRCKTRATILGSHKLKVTIPETPDSLSAHQDSEDDSPQVAESGSSVTTPIEPGSPASTLCFNSGLVGSKSKKLVQEKVRRSDSTTEEETDESARPASQPLVDQAVIIPKTPGETTVGPTGSGTETRLKYRRGQYSYRELVGMALLASDGRPWSTLQIQNWVADNFPEYRQGPAMGEHSLAAVLSGTNDFQGAKLVEDGRMRSWTFANASARQHYEELFTEHLRSGTASEQHSSGSLHDHQADTARKASPVVKINHPHPAKAQTAPPAPADPRTIQNTPLHAEPSELRETNKVSASREICGIFMPFERAQLFSPTDNSDQGSYIRRETSFLKAFPEYEKPLAETMSETDIEKKIAEIKKRPSRKATWGDRLTFVRSHRRDVHDETAGAWRPRFSIPQKMESVAVGDTDEGAHNKEAKGLGDIFELPDNPLLMLHEGQLAFRDGTLVSLKANCYRKSLLT